MTYALPRIIQEKLASIDYSWHLIHSNGIDRLGFQKWVLPRGMLFDSAEKWWPSEGERPTGHEGLDLCLFQDEHGNLRELVAPIQGQAAMDGKLVKIMLDFLDLSIVVYHGEFSDAEWGSPRFMPIPPQKTAQSRAKRSRKAPR